MRLVHRGATAHLDDAHRTDATLERTVDSAIATGINPNLSEIHVTTELITIPTNEQHPSTKVTIRLADQATIFHPLRSQLDQCKRKLKKATTKWSHLRVSTTQIRK